MRRCGSFATWSGSIESAERQHIGVLYLDSREKGRLLSPPARTALEALATEAALAIENARLYQEGVEKARLDEELRTASRIQQALLPEGRRTGRFFEAVGASIPSRAIGGDFFDYQDLAGRPLRLRTRRRHRQGPAGRAAHGARPGDSCGARVDRDRDPTR